MDSIVKLAKLLILESYQNEDSLGNYITQIKKWLGEFEDWLMKRKPKLIDQLIETYGEEEIDDILLYQPSPDIEVEANLLMAWAEWCISNKKAMEELRDELYDYLYWKEEPADFFYWINSPDNSPIQMPKSPEEVVKMCKEFWPEKNWKTGHIIITSQEG